MDSFIGMVVPHHGGDPESIGIYWNGGAGPIPVATGPGTYLSIWVWIEIFGLYYNV